MSNYILKPRDDNHEVMVGWDPPLSTFFLHVIDKSKAEDEEGYDVFWVGTKSHEIGDLTYILVLAREYAPVSRDVVKALMIDSD